MCNPAGASGDSGVESGRAKPNPVDPGTQKLDKVKYEGSCICLLSLLVWGDKTRPKTFFSFAPIVNRHRHPTSPARLVKRSLLPLFQRHHSISFLSLTLLIICNNS